MLSNQPHVQYLLLLNELSHRVIDRFDLHTACLRLEHAGLGEYETETSLLSFLVCVAPHVRCNFAIGHLPSAKATTHSSRYQSIS